MILQIRSDCIIKKYHEFAAGIFRGERPYLQKKRRSITNDRGEKDLSHDRSSKSARPKVNACEYKSQIHNDYSIIT